MVSGTQCPAWSDQLKRWSESKAAAPKGRCPVGHRDEFPYVLEKHISGLWGNFPLYSVGVFLQLRVYFLFYPIGIMHIFHFLFIFHVIQYINRKFAYFYFL